MRSDIGMGLCSYISQGIWLLKGQGYGSGPRPRATCNSNLGFPTIKGSHCGSPIEYMVAKRP